MRYHNRTLNGRLNTSWPVTTIQSIRKQASTSTHWTVLMTMTLSLMIGIILALNIAVHLHPYNYVYQLASLSVGLFIGYYATPKPISRMLDDHELRVTQLIAFGLVFTHTMTLVNQTVSWVITRPIASLMILSLVVVIIGSFQLLFGPRDTLAE